MQMIRRVTFSALLTAGLAMSLGVSAVAASPAPSDDVTIADALKLSLIALHQPFPPARVPSNVSAQGTWASGYVSMAELRHYPFFENDLLNVFRTATRADIVDILSQIFHLSPTEIDRRSGAKRDGSTMSRTVFLAVLSATIKSDAPLPAFIPSNTVAIPVDHASSSAPAPASASSSAPSMNALVPPSANGPTGVMTQAANVRYRADMTSHAIDSFPGGTMLIILDQSDPVWLFVQLPDGRQGYVSRKFVKM